jgi:hypothetical protein
MSGVVDAGVEISSEAPEIAEGVESTVKTGEEIFKGVEEAGKTVKEYQQKIKTAKDTLDAVKDIWDMGKDIVGIKGGTHKDIKGDEPLPSVPEKPDPHPGLGAIDYTPPAINVNVYGGQGAGVPRYPHEAVIRPKRQRSHKTHHRKR